MAKQLPRNWVAIREGWPDLTAYQRFEVTVAAKVVMLRKRTASPGRQSHRA